MKRASAQSNKDIAAIKPIKSKKEGNMISFRYLQDTTSANAKSQDKLQLKSSGNL